MQIIDSEMHPVLNLPEGKLQVSYDSLIKCMDRNRVDMAVVLPSWDIDNVPGSALEEIAKKNPRRLVPWCKFFYNNPTQPGGWGKEKDRAIEEMTRMLESGVFKGVGEFNLGETWMDDPYQAVKEYYPFMDLVARYKAPVQFHTGFGHSGPLPFLDPMLLDLLASRYPEVPFLIDHCGYMLPPFGDISVYMATENENVYLQLSNLYLIKDEEGRKIYKKWVERVLKTHGVGASKLIFGTDWYPAYQGNPSYDDEADWQVKILTEIAMSENERALVMGGNLKRLMKI